MPLPAKIKRDVRELARNRCEYCHSQEPFSPSTFSIEHIVPLSVGGAHAVKNLALSCQQCNNRKYTSVTALDPLNGDLVRLFHPRQDHWSDHFAWNEDFTLLLALTPTGRATTEKLQLNRTSLINLRRVLHQAGFHPLPEQPNLRSIVQCRETDLKEER
jgi:hypothetical protein